MGPAAARRRHARRGNRCGAERGYRRPVSGVRSPLHRHKAGRWRGEAAPFGRARIRHDAARPPHRGGRLSTRQLRQNGVITNDVRRYFRLGDLSRRLRQLSSVRGRPGDYCVASEDEWRDRISTAAVAAASSVSALTYRKIRFQSFSSPVVLGCDDGHNYVVKALGKKPGLHRALFNDPTMGALAGFIGAPVPAACTASHVPDET